VKTIAAAGAALAADGARGAARSPAATTWDVVVAGSGVFGAWTAYCLQRAGKHVLLVDQYGPANSRSSSSGETRIIRMGYGAKELYTRWAWQSLAEWKEFSARCGEALFHPTGVLWIGKPKDETLEQSAATMRKLSIPCELVSHQELQRRFPQISAADELTGLWEPPAGALMARRAVQAVARETVKAGTDLRTGLVAAPTGRGRVVSIAVNGEPVSAGAFVFACGPWLPRVFPELLAGKIVPTRGEEFFFGPASGDARFAFPPTPTWIDLTAETFGTPDIEGRGFKVGIDLHGPAFDPDRDSRTLREESLKFARDYLARRFPGMKGAPLLEHRVCQYENAANEDFLIDRHPDHENVWLVGGGSGHGFKHGPAVGAYVAKKVMEGGEVDPAFRLANHADVKDPSIFKQ
jgi:sarcosine oxidase